MAELEYDTRQSKKMLSKYEPKPSVFSLVGGPMMRLLRNQGPGPRWRSAEIDAMATLKNRVDLKRHQKGIASTSCRVGGMRRQSPMPRRP